MYFSALFSSVLFAFVVFVDTEAASNYYGKFIGSLKSYHHALAGDVYVVDSRTLHVRNFNYDGEGPAGYFYVANTKEPGENGIKLRDDRGSTEPLRRYRKKHITLTLPEGKTINNIKWFYVWCDEFAVNFGDVKIPKNFEFPKPQKIGRLNGVHAVQSDNVVVVDAQTLLIPSFSYDGEAPDAKFWVGNGKEPTPQGIRVPDENGKEEPLRKYDRKTIVLTLPGDITIFDIGNFAIWCEAFTVDFGHVEIPKSLNVPPSLKMLGVSPQKYVLRSVRSFNPTESSSSHSLYSELLQPVYVATSTSSTARTRNINNYRRDVRHVIRTRDTSVVNYNSTDNSNTSATFAPPVVNVTTTTSPKFGGYTYPVPGKNVTVFDKLDDDGNSTNGDNKTNHNCPNTVRAANVTVKNDNGTQQPPKMDVNGTSDDNSVDSEKMVQSSTATPPSNGSTDAQPVKQIDDVDITTTTYAPRNETFENVTTSEPQETMNATTIITVSTGAPPSVTPQSSRNSSSVIEIIPSISTEYKELIDNKSYGPQSADYTRVEFGSGYTADAWSGKNVIYHKEHSSPTVGKLIDLTASKSETDRSGRELQSQRFGGRVNRPWAAATASSWRTDKRESTDGYARPSPPVKRRSPSKWRRKGSRGQQNADRADDEQTRPNDRKNGESFRATNTQAYHNDINSLLFWSHSPSGRRLSAEQVVDSKLNCEILYDDLAFEVRWAVAGESIVIQLVAKLEKGEYMSFGLSGQINENVMVGGDVVVAWIDHETLSGYAYDYYLDAKSQCAGGHGSCPDVKLSPNTENIRLLNAALVNGYSIVTYQRPLRAHDQFDLPIYTNGSQAVIWAIGPLNSLKEVSYHSITSKVTTLIDFGRPPQWNCPIPESDAAVSNPETNDNYESNVATYATVNEQIRTQTEPTIRTKTPEQRHTEVTARTSTRRPEATPAPVKREKPWDIPPIQCYEPDDGIFYAQMGPTGGKRGYSAITGHVGWGISWYINGLLIPEINVVRGRSYTFVVEGGLDPEIPAKYHPFYITDDPVGGYHYKTPEEKAKVRVFAGVTQNKAGEYTPTGIGRLCNWTPDQDQPPADEFVSFGAYQRTLILNCEHGEPGVVQWTPDEKTPDTVYYQCYSHRYLGWKINVHDSCDKESAASEPVTSRIRVNADAAEELLPNASIQVETRVKPQNSTSAQPNTYVSPVKETKEKSHYKDEYTDNERIILQDPYLPPPPYQKNFDYQSMQLTAAEPARDTKPSTVITERTVQRSTVAQFAPHAKEPTSLHNVSTKATPQHVTVAKHKPHLRKEPYLFQKPDFPAAMHIHVVKHADAAAAETTLPKSYAARPYRHSMMLKKPHAYKMASTPYGYSLRTPHYTKLAKQNGDARASGSMPAKSVLAAPLRNAIPKLPHMHMPYIGLPAQSAKKSYYSRKREEPKFAHYTNRIVDESYQERSKDGMTVGGAGGGFNPSSIVIESGFKPIIPSTDAGGASSLPTAAVNTAQERISSDDTAVEDYVDESKEPQPLLMGVPGVVSTNRSNHHDDRAKNPFEGRQPELFEPMFIPSPLTEQQQRKKQKPIVVNRSKHKPSNGIAYIWPNENEKDAFYDYYTMNAVLPAYTGKVDTAEDRNGVVLDGTAAAATQTSSPSVLDKTSKGVTHTYKVTEYVIDENSNRDEIDAAEEEQGGRQKEDERVAATDEAAVDISGPNINNTTEKIVPQMGDSVLVQRTNNGNGSNYKIRYIPVGYSSKNSKSDNGPEEDDKFVITIRNDEVTQTTSSDGSIK